MIARKLLALGLALIFLGGCGETVLTLKKFNFSPGVSGPLEKGFIYYVEAKGEIISSAIIYRNEKPCIYNKDNPCSDPELVVILTGVTIDIWHKIIPALISAGGQVVSAGIYGISLPVAKSVVSAVAGGSTATGTGGSSTATGTGGSGTGGSATGGQGGSSTATGGSTGTITNTNTSTGGSSTNTNTNNACTGSNSCD